VVFAHNDLLSGNLMLNDLEGKYHIHLSHSCDYSVEVFFKLQISYLLTFICKAEMVFVFVVIYFFLQRSSISLILSMDHIATAALTLETISMSTQALIVIITCTFSSLLAGRII
jgi:hypothetical protein